MDDSIVVVGAGAAGIACTLGLLRLGLPVVLVERREAVGGTVVHSLIHTLGGLYNARGEYLNSGLCVELVERLCLTDTATQRRRIGRTWTLACDPAHYARVVQQWLAEYPNLQQHNASMVTAIEQRAGRIEEVRLVTQRGTRRIACRALVDASGGGAIAHSLSTPDSLPATHRAPQSTAAAGRIVRMRGVVAETLAFPKGVALLQRVRRAAHAGALPQACADLWLDRGVYADEVYLKFTLSPESAGGNEIPAAAERLRAWLAEEPGFAAARLDVVGEVGERANQAVATEYCLTESDLLAGRQFTDALCRAAWPIEQWRPGHGVSLQYLPDDRHYTIPLRALRVRGYDNLYVAGRALGATPRAQASARVVGSCWAMGEGLAKHLAGEGAA